MDRLLTAEEVAVRLAVKKSWVYEQARRQRIPVIYLGRYPRFDWAEVEAWAKLKERGAVLHAR